MSMFMKRSRFALVAPAVLVSSMVAGAQTFRGNLTGTVTDASGAAIPNASLQLTNPATNEVLNGKANGAGDFSFPELAVGTYSLQVSAPGFSAKNVGNIAIEVSKINNQKVELTVGSEGTTIEVQASGVTVDTTTSSLVAVIDSKSVQNAPLNGRDFTKLTRLSAGVGAYSNTVNGSRTAGVNFQVDGADNNDAWSNAVASNQGGVAGIAGGLIPIEAIDQFSMQAAGEADMGRNGGANSNMVIKSGTNHLHGDVFYFDRNEYFAWLSPAQLQHTRTPEIRNHQGGFTIGGPIFKDKTFFFLAGEIQIANANNSVGDTVLSDAWVSDATRLLALHNLTANAVSLNLYRDLFPAASKGGTATTGNYLSNGRNTYNSYNGIIKLDHNFSDKYTISARYLGTTGTQSADVGSHYADYFQTAPMHIHNFSVVQNSTFSSSLVNQVVFAASSFLQTFNDRNQNYNPQADGLNLGLSGILANGATQLCFGSSCGSSFDYTGATAPLGRQDVTGHVSDTLHWTVGHHDMKFGGEYRHANLNVAYYTNGRGSFKFDGTRGPWSTADCTTLGYSATNADAAGHNCSALEQVADFLNGQPQGTSGAQILRNNPQRVYLVNSFDAFAADTFKVNQRLTLNYGVRWSYPGTVSDDRSSLYNFTPQQGFFPESLYNRNLGNVAPRVGFAFQPFKDNSTTVVRGAFGWFFDQPTVGQFVYDNIGNTGATGIYSNPAGPNPVFNLTAANYTFGAPASAFPSTLSATAAVGVLAINPNYRAAYMENYNLNVEQQLSRSTLLTVAYVGSVGRRLAYISDINQITPNPASHIRPLSTTPAYANFQAVNQVNSGATSNYNSLQVSLTQSEWHGITTKFYYTWSKALDTVSSVTTPMNSYSLRSDYGPSTFDTRNTVNGVASYTVPTFTHHMVRLTGGYQVNALYTFAGGQPINILVGSNVSGTGENKDRPNRVAAQAYVSRAELTTTKSSARTYSYLSKSAWASPAATGVTTCYCYGNERRDSVYGPGFGTVDMSLIKRTPISEHVNTELRADVFNIANQANFANPSGTLSSSSFGVLTQTRNGSSAPGLGYGEPRNIQFAFKVSF